MCLAMSSSCNEFGAIYMKDFTELYLNISSEGNLASTLFYQAIGANNVARMMTADCTFNANTPNNQQDYSPNPTVFAAFGPLPVQTQPNKGLPYSQQSLPPIGTCQRFNTAQIIAETPPLFQPGTRTVEPLVDK
jgi:hypothetical protein